MEQPKLVFEEHFKQKQNLPLVPVNSGEINVREEKKEHSTSRMFEESLAISPIEFIFVLHETLAFGLL